MRRIALAALFAATLGFAQPGHAATTITVEMSNFRFCAGTLAAPAPVGAICVPTDQGATFNVPSGVPVTIQFVYNDHACDALQVCPGHNAFADDGSFAAGPDSGTHSSFSATVTLQPGQSIPFHCTIHGPFGMTGILYGSYY